MNASTQRADLPQASDPEGAAATAAPQDSQFDSGFDSLQWQESAAEREFQGAGGRNVLGAALILLAALWVAYCAWAAGRALADQPPSSPAIAQWMALAAGPLALLGLAWIMFGRTRRKETERFTRSVTQMRTEARSLEALLGVLSQRINDSRSELTMIAQHLMQLGDQTSGKFASVTRELDSSSERMALHSSALDRAAESARNDIAVLLDDLPRAEASARTMAETLRSAGGEASRGAADFERQVTALSGATQQADEIVSVATQRLVTHLTHIESAGAAAASQVTEAETAMSATVDRLLGITADALDRVRAGIDSHSAAVNALVEQATAGLGRASMDAADALSDNVGTANRALDGLRARLDEQEQASARITAETSRALGALERQFATLAEEGDKRAAALITAIGMARSEIRTLGAEADNQQGGIDDLVGRTTALRSGVEQLAKLVREQLTSAVGQTESSTERLLTAAQSARPEIEWMRDAAVEAEQRIAASSSGIADQQDRFAALLASIDDGVTGAQDRLAGLVDSVTRAQGEAERLSQDTGPALVQAMVQVREAAALAAERARSAITQIVPQAAGELSAATREALEQAIREGIEERLREVETVAAAAVESARSASDRLTQQMLALGQSAVALEQHMEQAGAEQREKDSEAFARRVSLLIDSMNSAAIDVGKILSDEVDEKAWESYLKGNRGVFTRRAVRLLDGGEARAIRAHYEADGEFQQSVNRYVHDFEAMLRRVLAERDGGMIAVTLMSSDMGKLYAALAHAIERLR